MTFLHGGDLGDLIYALPAIRAAGGGILYLTELKPGREPLNAGRRQAIIPLLRLLDYIEDIQLHQSEPVDLDFTGFRKSLRPGERNLAETQLEFAGFPISLASEAWIDPHCLGGAVEHLPIIVHWTDRYRNPIFPWREFVTRFGRRAYFLGLSTEYSAFVEQYGSIWHRPTTDLLEMARLIASGGLFVGNQSVGYALAEAMKLPAVLEAYPPFLDCRFHREDVHEVLREPPDWNWLESQLDKKKI